MTSESSSRITGAIDIGEEAANVSNKECFVCYILELNECDCSETR
jgi:hypothetical protein